MGEDWGSKGATLTDGTACKEFGLTQQEVRAAIRAGELQVRETAIHGNPCVRLLRREVEAMVVRARGAEYLQAQRTRRELAEVQSELRRLNKVVAELERRKAVLIERAGRDAQ